MRAIQIKREAPGSITIRWDDGKKMTFTLQELRNACPCAGCKGEVLFGTVYRPAQLPVFTPHMYELESLIPVGQYGVQASWKDGHNTGIYSWEYLYALGEEKLAAENESR